MSTLMKPILKNDFFPVMAAVGSRRRGGITFENFTEYSNNPLGKIIGGVSGTFWARAAVYVDNTFHMFQETQQSEPAWEIHKRTSPDGLHFTEMGPALLSPGTTGTYDDNGQADPSVIYDGAGDWKMWFDALSVDGRWTLGHATSPDGDTWTNQGQILEKGIEGEWDSNSLHHPSVIRVGGTYYMFYSGSKSGNPNSVVGDIGLATSLDGINFTKHTSNPLLVRGETGAFDHDYLRPTIPVLINGLWYMFYWGFDGSVHSTGLATSKDLITWTKKGRKYTNEDGASATPLILFEGTEVKDKIVTGWSNEFPNQSSNFVKITKSTLGNKIDQFTTDREAYFGDDALEGSSSPRTSDRIDLFRVSATANQTVDHVKMFVASGTSQRADGKCKLAVYSNNGDTPENLLTLSEEVDASYLAKGEWNDIPRVSDLMLTSGTDYWLALWKDGNSNWLRLLIGAGGSNNHGSLALEYGAWPDPITADTSYGYNK
ncbi:MAG: hypothetical protein ACOC2F_02720, partial [Bacteroidota bacterium]